MRSAGWLLAAILPVWAIANWKHGTPMPLPRAGYIAGAARGKLIIAGGSYWEGDRKIWSARTDLYDPATGAWTAGLPLPVPRSDAACLVWNSALHAWGGGAEGSMSAECLRLENGKWRTVPEMNLPEPRLYSVASQLDRRIYVFGGIREAGKHETAANTLWRWNSERQRWDVCASLPGPPRSLNGFAASGGKLYVLGGYTVQNGAAANLDDVWEYDPAGDQWNPAGRFPVASRAWWALSDPTGRVLLFGGYTDSFSAEIWSYDPKTATSTVAGSLPIALADTKFFRIGREFVGTGGESGPHIRSRATLQGAF